jgi:hypothetical protein
VPKLLRDIWTLPVFPLILVVSIRGSMATWFIAENPNPAALFPGIQAFAQQNGYQLVGNASAGSFSGRVMFLGEVSGNYVVSGTQVTIRTNKDLPAGIVAQRLGRVGLRVISSG